MTLIEAIDKAMLALAIRVIASWKTTLFGVLLGLGTDTLTQLQLVPNQYVHALALLLAGVFATFRDAQYAKGAAIKIIPPLMAALVFFLPMRAHAQTSVEEAAIEHDALLVYHPLASGGWLIVGGVPMTEQPVSGTYANVPSDTVMVREASFPAVLIDVPAFKAATPGAAAGAAAIETGTPPLTDDPPPVVVPAPLPAGPVIGGCFGALKQWCVAPAAAVSVIAINLSKGIIEGGFSPGAGLGLTYNTGQWYSVGLNLLLNMDVGAQNFNGAAMGSFLNGWLRVGYSKGFIGDRSGRMLFGIGIL